MRFIKTDLSIRQQKCRLPLIFYGLAIIWIAACNRCDDSTTQRAKEKDASAEIIGHTPGYKLNEPDHIARLPKKLKEASDVTAIGATAVAMVQDEKGIIYLYDLNTDDVIRKIKFGPKGDYEGLAQVGDVMYVLESSGVLYKINNWQLNASAKASELNLPTKDNEGLCYDPLSKKLLISPKSRWKKKKGGGKHKRPVFEFDPTTDNMGVEPAFVLNTKDILAFANKHGLTIPVRTTKKGNIKENLRFLPAAVAVHPKTNEIYVVSAVDRVIVSFDRQSRLTGFSQLDKKLFMQPEGIAFLPDGTLVVVNESPKKKPGLLTFKWRVQK